MKRIIFLTLLSLMTISVRSESFIESINEVSDNYVESVQDTVFIRNINGGTVIIPIYDDSCPPEMQNAFSYACKIIEEYIPPCLPLNIKVSCGTLTGASRSAISKIQLRNEINFGNNATYRNAPTSMIKGVLAAEISYNSSKSYLDSIPNVEFLKNNIDLNVIYNIDKLNDLSFSLEANPGQKYDFVSLAIRDILKGLGLSSSYKYDSANRSLINPSQEMTPFEYYINEMLGNYGNGTARLEAATQGELELGRYYNERMKLYAPTTWQDGISLNYFIPQDDSDVSKILSYDFCKGMVTRSLNDSYSGFIFRELLGWMPDYVSGSGAPVPAGGSTSLKMPYNGAISFGSDSSFGITTYSNESAASVSQKAIKRTRGIEEEMRVLQYVDSFRPFITDGQLESYGSGMSFSILKKDGTWDMVYFLGLYFSGMPFELNMSDCEFHYDSDEYARTIDGYLRGRLTTKETIAYNSYRYNSTFFVIDYLPQKVKLTCKLMDDTQTASVNSVDPMAVTYYPVRIYFSDIEGVNRIVLERLRAGFRVPSKIEVTDFKQGYHDLTIDRETTFTAVAYNDNGSSRSIPVTIAPITTATAVSALQFSISEGEIRIERPDNGDMSYSYTITPINVMYVSDAITGECNGNIDTSNLADGIYVLSVTDTTGNTGTFKFRK